MLFLLEIVLILNLIIAYKIFRNLISPPVLLAIGMAIAGGVCLLYYSEWQMNQFLYSSAIILGFSPVLFTLFCILFRDKKISIKPIQYNLESLYIRRFKLLLFFSIIIGILGSYLKFKNYQSYFGISSLPELLLDMRVDAIGERDFVLNPIVRAVGTYNVILSYFVFWFWSIQIVTKLKDVFFSSMCIIYLLVVVIDGTMAGSKAAMIDPIIRFVVIYLFVLFTYKGETIIPTQTKIKLSVLFFIFLFSFQLIGNILGRDVESISLMDHLAEYWGAQIKNFDIYMHMSNKSEIQKLFGQSTFHMLYIDIGLIEDETSWEGYQTVGKYNLGNVYTQYYSFYKDFGVIGIVVMSMIIAKISMSVYENAMKRQGNRIIPNIFILLYATIALAVFMSFFSSRFTESVFRLKFIKSIAYFYIYNFIFKTFFVQKSHKKNETCLCNSHI